MNLSQLKYIAFFFTVFVSVNNAQTFGFGCLGLSGFYGGFSQQQYSAEGINKFAFDNYTGSLPNHEVKFEKGTGFRVGANIFRAKFDDVFLTVKGYYQFLKEVHEFSETNQDGVLKNKYQLSMNHWGIGLDFGFPLFSIVDLKLLEGGVAFYNSDFSYQIILNDTQQNEIKISPDKIQMGYYIGSGLIIHLIKDYISIEGTAAYSFLQIDEMKNDSGFAVSPSSSQKKAVDKGGIVGTIQLNVGFPF